MSSLYTKNYEFENDDRVIKFSFKIISTNCYDFFWMLHVLQVFSSSVFTVVVCHVVAVGIDRVWDQDSNDQRQKCSDT